MSKVATEPAINRAVRRASIVSRPGVSSRRTDFLGLLLTSCGVRFFFLFPFFIPVPVPVTGVSREDAACSRLGSSATASGSGAAFQRRGRNPPVLVEEPALEGR